MSLYDDRVRVEDDDLQAIGYRVNATLIRRTPEWANVVTALDATSIAGGLAFDQRYERPSLVLVECARNTGPEYGKSESEE